MNMSRAVLNRVTRLSRRARALTPSIAGAAALLLAGALPAGGAPTVATPGEGAAAFGVTSGEQTFTVPAGVTSLHVKLVGAAGSSGPVLLGEAGPGGARPGGARNGATRNGFTNGDGGAGAVVEADLSVTPGQVLYLQVGTTGVGSGGGYNGGGMGASAAGITATGARAASAEVVTMVGGGGGGATDIRTVSCGAESTVCAAGGPGPSQASRLLVAGGGGGGGSRSGGSGIGDAADGGDGGGAGALGAGAGGPGADGADVTNAQGGGGGGGATASAVGAAGTAGVGTLAGATEMLPPVGSTPGSGATGGDGGPGGASGGGGGGGGYLGGGGGGSGGLTFGNNGAGAGAVEGSSGGSGGGGGGGAGSSWADLSHASNVTVVADTTGTPLVEITYDPVAPRLTLVIGDETVPLDGKGRRVVTAGEEFLVAGRDLMPASTVVVDVRSIPVVLARPLVAVDGTFVTTVVLPANLAAGEHTLTASGIDVNGDPVVASIALVILLPVTGSPIGPIALGGLLAVLLGVAALIGVRRWGRHVRTG